MGGRRNALIAVLFVAAILVMNGAYALEPIVVRTVSADPGARAYSFACTENPQGSGLAGNGVRNWYIYPEDTNAMEATFSLPAGQNLNYTFGRNAYYNVGCIVPNPPGLNYSSFYRHDLHIDLSTTAGNPGIIPLSAVPGQISEMCVYNGTNYTTRWELSTYAFAGGGNTTHYPLNVTSANITFTPPTTPGLFDTHCIVHTSGGQDIDVPWGIDFLGAGAAPYVADKYGIWAGNSSFAPFDATAWNNQHNGAPTSGGNSSGNSSGNATNSTTTNFTLTVLSSPIGGLSINGTTYSLTPQTVPLPTGSYLVMVSAANYTPNSTTVSLTGNMTLNLTLSAVPANTSGNGTNATGNITNTTCYTGAQTIPASCSAGTVTTDAIGSNGCRITTCANGPNTITAMTCNKPGDYLPTYFEIYKQNSTGTTPPNICIGNTCLNNNGFAISTNYPICINTNNTGNTTGNGTGSGGNTTPPLNATLTVLSSPAGGNISLNGTASGATPRVFSLAPGSYAIGISAANLTPNNTIVTLGANATVTINLTLSTIPTNGSGNGTNATGNITNTTCYTGAQTIPASCSAGTVTTDAIGSNGCRITTCANGPNTITAMTCNKPGDYLPTYFEIYKQNSTGTTPPNICIGNTCLNNNGFAISTNYPICINTNNTGNTTGNGTGSGGNTTGNGTGSGGNTTGNGTGSGGNTTGNCSAPLPQAPVWLEPGATGVYPNDFHLHTANAVDPQGNPINVFASDFEIWDVPTAQLVWASYHESVDPYHIHITDGTFMGSLANQTILLYNRTYEVRARFYRDALCGNVSDWSAWRVFQTMPPINITPTANSWTPAPGYAITKVAGNINLPVNVIIAPNLYANSGLTPAKQPHLYVSQLYGQIGVILNDGTYTQYAGNLLGAPPPGGIPGGGEAGVDGLYVDAVTGGLYASMSYMDNTSITGMSAKVVHFATNATGDGYTSSNIIIDKIPVRPSHEAHTILKGPDGKMYLSVGDGDQLSWPQDPTKFGGKVLRINWNGSMPSDNPFPGTYTYALGFRNPFGMAFRPGTNELYVSNNGQDTDDGLYKTLPGSTFGWPTSLTQGVWQGWPVEIAPTQVGFDAIDAFPNDTQNVYVVGSGSTYLQGPSPNSKRIFRIPINPDGTPGNQTPIVTYTGAGYGDPIGVAFAPDGAYFTDIYGDAGFTGAGVTQGNVYKVVWTGQNSTSNQTNSTPPASFSAVMAQHPWFPQGLNMIWDCKTTGGSGNFTYDYVYGDGSQQVGYSQNNSWHTYTAHGTYNASCVAHDMNTSLTAQGSTIITL